MSETSESLAGWVTVSDLARMRGVNKSAISKRAARLETLGVLHPKAGRGREKLISVAEFDRAIGDTTDAVREANGRSAIEGAVVPSDPILVREQARNAAIRADLAPLRRPVTAGRLP